MRDWSGLPHRLGEAAEQASTLLSALAHALLHSGPDSKVPERCCYCRDDMTRYLEL